MKVPAVFLLLPICCAAETTTLTLKQAIDMAVQQSPDVVLARLDQQRARYQVTIARDPFSPKVFAGSGLAWTDGFPTSIDGNAPSVLQAKTQMALYDRPQSFLVAQANEALRGAEIDVTSRQQEVAYRVATLFLDAQHASRSLAAVKREADTLARVQQSVAARVEEGRELSIESSKANLAILRARQRLDALTEDAINAETSLALVLGLGPDDRVHPAEENLSDLEAPPSEDAAIQVALESSPELKRLESNLQAKTLEIKSYKAQRLPKVDLVAQYSLLAPYNNFQQYFTRFQRNNIELGASVQIPVLAGHAGTAYAAQATTDASKLRTEVSRTRGRISTDIQRAFRDVRRADEARDVAKADLDLAREQVTLDLAQVDEGKLPQAKLDQDRATEDEKWIAYYEAQSTAERARLSVLRLTGTLLEAVK